MKKNSVQQKGILERKELTTTYLIFVFMFSVMMDIKAIILSVRKRDKKDYITGIVVITVMLLTLLGLHLNDIRGYRVENFHKVSVTIGVGDNPSTVWEAQKELTPHKDVDKMLWLDKSINNLKDLNDLKVGQQVLLLKEK